MHVLPGHSVVVCVVGRLKGTSHGILETCHQLCTVLPAVVEP